ncbi:MAG: beta strand repeat-containing protein, partial [Planctomyces sp.]
TSGALALGNGSDTLTFTGGLVHTAGASTLAGNSTTSNTDIQLAGLTLASNSDVDTTGSSAGNILFTSSIATAGFALTLDAGPSGNISLAGNLTGGGAMTVRDGNVQAYAALTVASLNIQDATTSVTFNGNVTTTGAITVASGGSVFQNGTLSAGSTTTITSTGSGDLSITSITAPNQPVTLSAPSGSITQSSGSITASTLEITAFAGIGTAGSPITTAPSGMTLAARSTTGGIFVANTGALIIGSIGTTTGLSLATSGNIIVRTASPLTVNSPVTNSVGGNIVLAAQGNVAADDLTINANISASGGNGSISLYAGDSISVSTGVTISAVGTGSILAAASTDYNAGTPQNGYDSPDALSGVVTMAGTAAISTVSGSITLRGDGSVTLTTVSSTDGNIPITAHYAGVGGGLGADATGAINDET